jgi:serine/threonine protein kinase
MVEILNYRNALPLGSMLLEYRLESVLGAGGFGMTYLAYDSVLDKRVAIKEYLPVELAVRALDGAIVPINTGSDYNYKWGLDRFLQEARLLAKFSHPNIVAVSRFFEANGTAYMVMNYESGLSLSQLLKRIPQPDEAMLTRILMPLLDGLHAVHEAGFLHRDIKPSNLFIRDTGHPVLLDFGSARMNLDPNKDLTSIVSPGFAPLEQYHANGKQGPWTDIYSFGGVLYWLVTGKKPVEAVGRIREDIQPSAVSLGDRKLYGVEFLGAIDWALKPNEQDRPQTVSAFRDALARGRGAPPMVTALSSMQEAAAVSMPVSVAFDKDWLKRVEQDVAGHLGPIASVMIRNAARKSATVAALLDTLAAELPEGIARTAFVRKFTGDQAPPLSMRLQPVSGTASQQPASEPMGATAMQRFGIDVLKQAETALAQHIGGIAKIVVRRAAQKARDERELYLLLGDEIADREERKAFVRKVLTPPARP